MDEKMDGFLDWTAAADFSRHEVRHEFPVKIRCNAVEALLHLQIFVKKERPEVT